MRRLTTSRYLASASKVGAAVACTKTAHRTSGSRYLQPPVRDHGRSFYAIALALTGLLSTHSQQTLAAPAPRGAPVRTVTAIEAPIRRTLEFTGSVIAERSASLSTATSGLVVALMADSGSRVKQGDVLLRLDSELAALQLQRDAADERRARQGLADSKRRLAEVQELATRQTIAQTTVRGLQSEVIEDEAALARSTAIKRLSKATLDRHQLIAPFSGVISARNTDLGEWITPGLALFELVSLDDLFVDVQVSETFLGDFEVGMPMMLSLPGLAADESLAARIVATVPVADSTTRTFLLRARAENSSGAMRPGMSVTARIALDTGQTRVTVPRDAVLRDSTRRTIVWVMQDIDGESRARERLVETGLRFDGQVEILNGVAAGDRVIVTGNEALRDQQLVHRLTNQEP